jgi:predicted lysophospholipase L1 biosynthesis ABC-type transport system permease subunit
VEDIPHVAAAIDTFLIVNALGAVAAALTCVGMLMYLQARQRSQVVSYALSARMGMRHGQHRRALVLELGVMLAWAFAIGSALSIAAARFTVPRLDPITAIPPSPFLVIPAAFIAAAAIVLGVVVWVGAAVTNRRSRSVDLGEVMRVAE